jgi:hypothetical protein
MVVSIGLFPVFLLFEVIVLRNYAFLNLALAEVLIILMFDQSHPFSAFVPEPVQTAIGRGALIALGMAGVVMVSINLRLRQRSRAD